jgi:ABC-type spermidine/putrescine transport system permease subunit II
MAAVAVVMLSVVLSLPAAIVLWRFEKTLCGCGLYTLNIRRTVQED